MSKAFAASGVSPAVTAQIQEAVLLHVPDPPTSCCAYPRLDLPGAHFKTMENAMFIGEVAIASLTHGGSCRVRLHGDRLDLHLERPNVKLSGIRTHIILDPNPWA